MPLYSTELERQILGTYATQAKEGIVEIGVLFGEMTGLFLDSVSPGVRVYGIDPLIPDSMNGGLIGSLEKIKANTANRRGEFLFYKDFSWDLVKKFVVPFDMIFIDGDHRFDAVCRDVWDWWPKLSIGGIMFLHDSAPVVSEKSDFKGHDGPIAAAAGMVKLGFEVEGVWDTLHAFKKRKNDDALCDGRLRLS